MYNIRTCKIKQGKSDTVGDYLAPIMVHVMCTYIHTHAHINTHITEGSRFYSDFQFRQGTNGHQSQATVLYALVPPCNAVTCMYILYTYRLYAESMEIRDIESRGPRAVAFRAQRGRY